MSSAGTTTELRIPVRPSLLRRIGSYILGIFTRRLPAKIAALVLGILVWVTVRKDITETELFPVVMDPAADLPPGLMIVGNYRDIEKVFLRGPTAKINAIREGGEVELNFTIREEDLLGRDQQTLTFSIDRGNIRHSEGATVTILETEPPDAIVITVARIGTRTVKVSAPKVVLPSLEWEARVDLLTPSVKVTGPKPVLDGLTSVEVFPIMGKEFTDRQGGADVEKMPLELKLADSVLSRQIRLADGERLDCQFTLVQSRITRPFQVPFLVLSKEREEPWPVVMVPSESDLLKRDGDGWLLEIEFTGTAEDLGQLASAIAGENLRAYVVADDFDPFRESEETVIYPEPVRLVMDDTLRRKVTFKPPRREAIQVEIRKRND